MQATRYEHHACDVITDSMSSHRAWFPWSPWCQNFLPLEHSKTACQNWSNESWLNTSKNISTSHPCKQQDTKHHALPLNARKIKSRRQSVWLGATRVAKSIVRICCLRHAPVQEKSQGECCHWRWLQKKCANTESTRSHHDFKWIRVHQRSTIHVEIILSRVELLLVHFLLVIVTLLVLQQDNHVIHHWWSCSCWPSCHWTQMRSNQGGHWRDWGQGEWQNPWWESVCLPPEPEEEKQRAPRIAQCHLAACIPLSVPLTQANGTCCQMKQLDRGLQTKQNLVR